MSDFILNNDRIMESLQKCKFMNPHISCKLEYGEIQIDVPASKDVPVSWYIIIETHPDEVRFTSRTSNNDIPRAVADAVIEAMKDSPIRVYWWGSRGLTVDIRVPKSNLSSENEFVSKMDIFYSYYADMWKMIADTAGLSAPEAFAFSTATVKESLDRCRFDGSAANYTVDSDGDICLDFPCGAKVTASNWFIWIYIHEDHITLDSGLPGVMPQVTAPVADYCDKMEGITVNRYDDRGARLKFRIESSAVADTANLVKRLEGAYGIFRDLWSMARTSLKIDTAVVKECLTSCGFMNGNVDYSVDSDGDIRVDVSPSGNDFAKWFCWCYIRPDHITFDTGSSKIPADFEKGIAESMKSGDGLEIGWNESRGMRIKATYRTDSIHTKDELRKIINDRLTNFNSFWLTVGNGYAEIQEMKAAEKRAQAEQARKAEQARQAESAAQIDSFTLSFDGNDEIRTIMKKFNKHLPYLRLGFYMVQTGQAADKRGGSISAYSRDTLFKDIRSYRGGSYDVDIDSRTTPADLEKMFRSQSGLVVKVSYTDGENNRYYISKDNSHYKMTLGKLNSLFKEKGYYYNDWY